MPQLSLVSLVVDDYDEAIAFFTDALGFDLIEDAPSTSSTTGEAKRWVVVRPSGAQTAILLARAANDAQRQALGNQTGGRVAFFMEVDDFGATHQRMVAAGVEFAEEPRHEPFGTVAVFFDISGNRWDLLGPAPADGVGGATGLVSDGG